MSLPHTVTPTDTDIEIATTEWLKQEKVYELMEEHKADAILIAQYVFSTNDVVESYSAYIFGDKKNRFDDGTPVRTSRVQSVTHINDGWDLVKTRNTTYVVMRTS